MRRRGIKVPAGWGDSVTGEAGAQAASAQAQSKPAAPTSVSVVRNTSGSLSVSWPAVDTANAYNVNYSSDNKGSWSRAHTEHSGTSVTISGTNDSLSYYIAVQAVNEQGGSGWTDSALVPAPTCANSIATRGPDANGNPDAAANPPAGLVADCTALLAIKSVLDPTGTNSALSTWNLFTNMGAYDCEDDNRQPKNEYHENKVYDGYRPCFHIPMPPTWWNGGWRGVTGYTGRVHHVSRANQGLTGTVPAGLKGLTALQSVNLGFNSLTGGIPSELGDIETLTGIFLSSNKLTESIPTDLGDLPALSSLIVDDNRLTGSIPTELGNVTTLTHIDLGENGLTGSIPKELGKLSALTNLRLDNNGLTESIPTELSNRSGEAGSSLSSLQYLDLGNNSLSGSIPTQLGTLSTLWELRLNNNGLTGSLPSELGSLSVLDWLDVSNNSLSGPIPTNLKKLSVLRHLNASSNSLSGAIPSDLGDLDKVEALYLQNNSLSGAIPTELTRLDSIKWLIMSGNSLNGSIPAEFATATTATLQYLDLSGNSLTGGIPTAFGGTGSTLTSSFYGLVLHNNNLSGRIPAELGNLSGLAYLWLSGNQFTQCIPDVLAKHKGNINPQQNSVNLPLVSELTPSLEASNVTGTKATLSMTTCDPQWHYKQTAPSDGTCSSELAWNASDQLTGLTYNTTYTYYSYKDNSCATKTAEVTFRTAAYFDTPFSDPEPPTQGTPSPAPETPTEDAPPPELPVEDDATLPPAPETPTEDAPPPELPVEDDATLPPALAVGPPEDQPSG